MMELRERIADIVREGCWAKDDNGNCHTKIFGAEVVADAILRLPELSAAQVRRASAFDRPLTVLGALWLVNGIFAAVFGAAFLVSAVA